MEFGGWIIRLIIQIFNSLLPSFGEGFYRRRSFLRPFPFPKVLSKLGLGLGQLRTLGIGVYSFQFKVLNPSIPFFFTKTRVPIRNDVGPPFKLDFWRFNSFLKRVPLLWGFCFPFFKLLFGLLSWS